MRASQNFVLREIAGEYMLIPVGSVANHFVGLITINEIGALILRALSTEQTRESLVKLVTEEYDVDSTTAEKDIDAFLDQLKAIGALVMC